LISKRNSIDLDRILNNAINESAVSEISKRKEVIKNETAAHFFAGGGRSNGRVGGMRKANHRTTTTRAGTTGTPNGEVPGTGLADNGARPKQPTGVLSQLLW
jgi:hypothetical protein